MSTKIQDPEEARSARDRFLDYMWTVTQDESEGAVRATAIQTLAEVYSAPAFTGARDPGPVRVRVALALALAVGLAVGGLGGLVLA